MREQSCALLERWMSGARAARLGVAARWRVQGAHVIPTPARQAPIGSHAHKMEEQP
jgi:hypothetical protein